MTGPNPKLVRAALGGRAIHMVLGPVALLASALGARNLPTSIADDMCRRGRITAARALLEGHVLRSLRRRAPPKPGRRRRVRPVLPRSATPPGDAERLRCLDEAVSALETAGFRPFLAFGTLLGLVREDGFLPRDTDIDLGLHAADANASEVGDRLTAAGFAIIDFEGPDWPCRVKARHVSGTTVDVVFFLPSDGALLTYTRYLDQPVIRRRTRFDLVRTEFEGRPVWVPYRPERFLEENYGDWHVRPAFYHHLLSSNLTDFSQAIVRYCAVRQFFRASKRGDDEKADAILSLVLRRCPDDPFWRNVAAIRATRGEA